MRTGARVPDATRRAYLRELIASARTSATGSPRWAAVLRAGKAHGLEPIHVSTLRRIWKQADKVPTPSAATSYLSGLGPYRPPAPPAWFAAHLETTPHDAAVWDLLCTQSAEFRCAQHWTSLEKVETRRAKMLSDVGVLVAGTVGNDAETVIAEVLHPSNAPRILTDPRVVRWVETYLSTGDVWAANRDAVGAVNG